MSFIKCLLFIVCEVPLLSKITAGSNAVLAMVCVLKKEMGKKGIFSMLSIE